MRRPLSALPVALGVIALGACAEAPPAEAPRAAVAPVIFGADDRVEVHEVVDAALRELVVRAVPAMVHQGRLGRDPISGAVTLSGSPLGEGRGLCEGEAFLEQPAVASCSATLIDDDLVLTAGHCVDAVACADQRYVFGWYYESPGVLRELEDASVYACAEVVAFELSGRNDFAIVRLDRAAPGPPVAVRTGPIAVDEVVSLAGYPLGVPMKVVEGGAVTGIRSATTFFARLDAHPGNSGSGVLDSELRVVGELTAGPISAFDDGGTCTVLRVIGEDAERTETINSVTPAIAALCGSSAATERLCSPACADGWCDEGEVCPIDCEVDGGLEDAGVDDAGIAAGDAAARDAGSTGEVIRDPDAGAATPPAAGCSCRAAGAPMSGARWAALTALAAIVARSRRRRAGGSLATRAAGR